MVEESRYPNDPFRDAPSSPAQETLYDAYDALLAALQKLGNDDALGRMRGLLWSVDRAPDVGFGFAEVAAENMRDGRYMLAADLVEDVRQNIELTEACFRQSRFARESVLRYLHASGDLLSQVVNAALGLGIGEASCNLYGVTMHENVQAHEPLARALNDLKESEVYKYAAAATNRMKHRTFLPGAIKASVNEDQTTVDVSHSTGAFTYNERELPKSSLHEVGVQTDELRLLVARVLDEILKVLSSGECDPRA